MAPLESRRTSEKTRVFLTHPTELGWIDFIDRYGPVIFRWCANMRNSNPDIAEQVTQTTLVKLFQGMRTYDHAKSFRRWLYTIARHAHADHLNGQEKRPIDSSFPVEEIPDPKHQFAEFLGKSDLYHCALERPRTELSTSQSSTDQRMWNSFDEVILQETGYESVAKDRQRTQSKLGQPLEPLNEIKETLYHDVSNVRKRIKELAKELGDNE